MSEQRATINSFAGLIWSIADLLRGDYKQSEYGRVVLPLVVLRRLDCVLEPTKAQVLRRLESTSVDNVGVLLKAITGLDVYNTSRLTLRTILADPAQVAGNLRAWIAAFDPDTRDVIEKFDFDAQVGRLDRAKILYQVVSRMTEVDLHPDKVSNAEMGYLYEELIRKFSEASNETAGEHFTPREVIRLMVDLLFAEDDEALRTPGIVRTLLDPACGTGGMLSAAADRLRELNPGAHLEAYGQELNAETYAICRSDMVLKGQPAGNIRLGNSFSEDQFRGERFDYCLANPPFGVEWKKVEREIRDEAGKLGFKGRFGAGTPRINDGSFLFLQHMISKLKAPADGGGRLAIVFNGSPLFTGGAGSGESEIRRWIIENDWLEGIVALPDQLFYNTGISTYFWIVTNRKRPERRGKVQLVDARELFTKMRKSLGEKRKEISEAQIEDIARLYGDFTEGERVKILPNEAFGFQRITVERPLRLRYQVTQATLPAIEASAGWAKLSPTEQTALADRLGALDALSTSDKAEAKHKMDPLPKAIEKAAWEAIAVRDPEAPVITDRKGSPEPDPDLRDNENVPLPGPVDGFDPDPTDRLASRPYRESVDAFMAAEVHPYVPDAWVDHTKTKVGYEIPLTRQFYRYVPPRPLEEIDAEIQALEAKIEALLGARRPGSQSNPPSARAAPLAPLLRLTPPERPIQYGIVLPGPNVDEGPRIIKGGDIINGGVAAWRLCRTTAEIERPYARSRVRAGDVVFAIRGAVGACGIIDIESAGANLTQDVARVSPTAEVHPVYLLFALQSVFVQAQAQSMVVGATVTGLNIRDLKRIQIPLPSLEAQREIAHYLTAETAHLDSIIRGRERQIALVNARFEAFREARVRDLVAEYGVVPLKRMATAIDQGWSPVCDAVPAEPDEWGVLKTSAVSSGRFVARENKRVSGEVAPDPRWVVHDGDLLVVRGSGSASAVGQAAVVATEGRRLLLADLLYRVRFAEADSAFVAEVLASQFVRDQLEAAIRTDVGMTRKIRTEDLANVLIPAAPPEVQHEEARLIQHELQFAMRSAVLTKAQVALLGERRSALMNAAIADQSMLPGVAA